MNYHTVYLHFKLGFLHSLSFLVVGYFSFLKDIQGEIFFGSLLFIYTISQTKSMFSLATEILLQGFPMSNDLDLNKIILQIQGLPHVVKVNETHYWAVHPEHLVFSSSIIVESFSHKNTVESAINNLLARDFHEIALDFDEAH